MPLEFYMPELATPDPDVLVAWYVAVLGLTIALADPATGFTLLSAPGGGRVAVKRGSPGRATLHFRVDDLPAATERLHAAGIDPGETKVSDEGYERVAVTDPARNRVVLFAWKTSRPA